MTIPELVAARKVQRGQIMKSRKHAVSYVSGNRKIVRFPLMVARFYVDHFPLHPFIAHFSCFFRLFVCCPSLPSAFVFIDYY